MFKKTLHNYLKIKYLLSNMFYYFYNIYSRVSGSSHVICGARGGPAPPPSLSKHLNWKVVWTPENEFELLKMSLNSWKAFALLKRSFNSWKWVLTPEHGFKLLKGVLTPEKDYNRNYKWPFSRGLVYLINNVEKNCRFSKFKSVQFW